jgi:adenylyltransferase/sulfurtransferase
MSLTESQLERYSRHIILSQVGGIGQEKLLNGRVLLIGAGGLGSPAALYLGAAGIGTIGLIDGDVVDLSNLQRQIAHRTVDIGVPKVESAAQAIRDINPDVKVKTYYELFTPENAERILADYDFVIDGTDNFPSKFMINDACYFYKKPLSHGGILRFHGQTLTILPGETACYRCLFNAPPPANAVPSCSQAGVLGVLAGVIGTIQATEAIKYILGQGELLTNRMLTYDALTMKFRDIHAKKQKGCSLCGENPTIHELHEVVQPVCDLKSR